MSPIPILSVCIPTYNRLHYLKKALETLLPQAELHGIEVCISDNHSTDGTAQYLEALAASGAPKLRYVVQAENIGLDRNMMTVIRMGTGRYIYPIGDDDVLPDGSLKAILRELEKDYDVIVLNGWHTDPSLAPKSKHLSRAIAGSEFSQPDQAFGALWDKMPFGSFLASRDCFSNNDFKRFIGTSHAYTGAVWDSLADKAKVKGSCRVRCMEAPTVLLRGAEKSWAKNAGIIMLYEIPLWFDLLTKKEAYKKIIPNIRGQYLKRQTCFFSLVQFRFIGQLEKSDMSMLCIGCSKYQKFKIILVGKLPKAALWALFKVRGALKRIYQVF